MMRDMIWVMRDGTRVPVSEMSDRHVADCIRKIRREGWRIRCLDRLLIEQVIRRIEGRSIPFNAAAGH
jgi:hypothetical protein